MAALDLETTGPEPDDARIVRAALARVGGGADTEWRRWLADPGVPIPPEATAIHGVTDALACAEGRDPAQVTGEVLAGVCAAAAEGLALVVFNARFDLTVLDREVRRHGLAPLHEFVTLLVVDPLVIDKHLERYRKGSRKLDAVCRRWGARQGSAHDPDQDAVAAARCAYALAKRGDVIRNPRGAQEAAEREALLQEWDDVRDDLPALQAAQARWAREQADGLQEYFDGLPLTDEYPERRHVPREWPIVPAGGFARPSAEPVAP
jgi:DNA polymerase III subunit epsilon